MPNKYWEIPLQHSPISLKRSLDNLRFTLQPSPTATKPPQNLSSYLSDMAPMLNTKIIISKPSFSTLADKVNKYAQKYFLVMDLV